MKKSTKKNWKIAGGVVVAIAMAGISAYLISQRIKNAPKAKKQKK